MTFVYPAFLFSLFALAIPVIIHLFNFRRYKTVMFPSIQFLKEVKQETTSQNRIKHWLVLLSRLLALLFLILAFAQPYINNTKASIHSGTHAVSIFVDNSYSMNAAHNGVPLIEMARQKAKEIVSGYNADDEFQIITNEADGKQQHLLSKEEALKEVDELKPTPSSAAFSIILQKQKTALAAAKSSNRFAYLVSDFQTSQLDVESFKTDTTIKYNAVSLQSDELANLTIDTCWFETPVQTVNQACRLLVKITNNGEADITANRITLKINEQLKSVGDFKVEKNSSVIDTIPFVVGQVGWNKCEVNINDNPVVFDDNYYFTFNVLEKINLTLINENKESVYLNTLFKHDEHFNISSADAKQLDYASLKDQQCIVLNELKTISSGLMAELQKFVSNGGSLIIIPGVAIDIASYNNLLTACQANGISNFQTNDQSVTYINTQENIFKDVFVKTTDNMDLPKVKKYYSFENKTATTEEKIMGLKNGMSLVSKYNVSKGKLYVLAVSLQEDYSDLPVKAVFVPMMVKMAYSGLQINSTAFVIGKSNVVEIPNDTKSTETAYKLANKNEEFIPEQQAMGANLILKINNHINHDGFYELKTNTDKPKPVLAFNYDRKESALKFLPHSDLADKLKAKNINIVDGMQTNMTGLVTEINQGIVLWKWCILLCLIFLLAEVLLLRFWKY